VDPQAAEPYPAEPAGTDPHRRDPQAGEGYRPDRTDDDMLRRDRRDEGILRRDRRDRDDDTMRRDRSSGDRWYDLATADDEIGWRSRTRVVLSPMAAPSIIGLFGFMGATLMVGAWQADWYGSASTPGIIWPFAIFFGGLAQLVAGFYALRARDTVAVAAHGTWGSFWLAWGLFQALVAAGVVSAIPLGATNPSFAMWFVVLASITLMAALAAMGQNLGMSALLWALAAGSALTAAGFWAGSLNVQRAGGVLFVISAGIAWLVASAMMFAGSFGRTIIPLGDYSKAGNVPGRIPMRPLQYSGGEPGVKVGQ
jgi:succinate-acetate transporter protein